MVDTQESFSGVGGIKLGFIEALGVRMKLGQIRYPEVMKAGINRAGNGTSLLYFVFNVFLLDDLPRDIIGCYFTLTAGSSIS